MHSSISFRSALIAGVAMTAVSPAAAQTISFNIPAQDLAGALQAFAVQTNRELLYSPQLVANRRTGGVSGSFTAPVALSRLLQGTDLEFRQPAPNVFVLQRNRPMARTTSVSTIAQAVPASVSASSAPGAAEAGAPGAVSGVVLDATTNSPLPGATLRLEGTNLSAVVDERGAYRFPAVPPGTYTVVLEYLGDASRSEQVTLASGEQVSLNFSRGDENEIVVYGYSSAVQSALNQQRTALNNATIVSEDLLGGFPAETVSEALRRVPGVAFTRAGDTGEGSGIAVRGFGSEAINIQVNGIDLQGTSFERTIDLSGYLAENISTITIHKTLLPSHQATGSGGFVQIETRSGLDYGDFHFSANIEGERALEGGFGNEWQAGATIGGRLTPNLGVVATVSYRDTNRRNLDVVTIANTPAVFPAGFTGVGTIPASQQFPFDPEFANRLVTGASYSQRTRDETTLAASLNLAWDIGNHTRLRLDLQRNEREASTYLVRSTVQLLPLGNIDMPVAELGGEIRRRIVLNSFRPGIGLASTDLNLVTDTVSLRGDTNIDRWQFRYKAGYARARSRSDNTALNLLGNTLTNIRDLIDPSTIVIQPDDDAARTPRVVDGGFVLLPNGVPVPSLTQAGISALLDPSGYRLTSAFRSRTNSPTEAWIFEGSARYTAGSWLDYLEAGFKYDRSRRSALDGTFATTAIGTLRNTNTYTPISGRDTFLSTIDPALLLTGSLGLIGVDFAIPSVNATGNQALFGALDRLLVDDPSTPFNEARFTLRDVTDADPVTNPSALQPASTTEERLAGYVEAHVEFGDFDIVGGARFERTRRTGTALAVPVITLPSNITEPRATFIALGLVDFLDTSSTDTTITPSILVNYRPSRHIVARLGYNRSTVNPSIQLIRRAPTYIVNLRTNRVGIQEGNPDLRPTVTDNFDLDLAYYFRNTPGLVRAGFFYKKTTNNFSNIFIAERPGEVRDRILTYFEPLVATRPELFVFNDQTEFFLSRPVNGEGGTIWGVELELIRRFDFLPGFLSGFGVIGNLTYTKGDFPTLVSGRTDDGVLTNFSLDRPLEEQAALVYNAALTYAGGGFEGRLIYTRQSVTVNTYEVHDINTVTPSYATLDLRLSYNFRGPGGGLFTLFLEGDDLLRDADDPDIRSAISNTPGRDDAQYFFPNIFQFNGGRTFTAGVRARF